MDKLKKAYFTEKHKIVVPQPVKDKGTPLNPQVFATGIHNLRQLGFVPSEELTKEMSELNYEQFVSLYKDLESMIKDEVGFVTGRSKVFYENFPNDVLEMSDAEMLINRLCGYIGTALFGTQWTPAQIVKERMKLIESFVRDAKVIGLGSKEDFEQMFIDRIFSNNSLSESKMDETLEFMRTSAAWLKPVMEKTIPNKENACQFVMGMSKFDFTNEERLAVYNHMLPTAVDVVRYAALLSNGRETNIKVPEYGYIRRGGKTITTKKMVTKPGKIQNAPTLEGDIRFKLDKSEQRLIKNLLADKKDLFNSVWLRPELFKRLGRTVSMRGKGVPERLAKAYDNLCTGERRDERGKLIMTPYARVERAFEEFHKASGFEFKNGKLVKTEELKKSLENINATAKAFPGVFSRNFFRFVEEAVKKVSGPVKQNTMAPSLGALVSKEETNVPADVAKLREAIITELGKIYAENCANVPIREQLKIMNVIMAQPDRNYRVIYESKINKYVKADVSASRKSITEEERRLANSFILKSLAKQFEGREALGKVYIDPAVYGLRLPENGERVSSKGSQLTSGSTIDSIKECNVVRPFIWWTNIDRNNRVDVDLSTVFYDANFQKVAECAYYSQKTYAGYTNDVIALSSGDITDGGPADGKGVCEFIDIDKEALKRHGIKYAQFTVHAFTSQPFKDMANIKFGFMQREGSLDIGKIDPESPFAFNGQIYEPSTVDFCCDLNTDKTSSTPMLYDVDNDRFVWVDKPIEIRHGLDNAANSEFLNASYAMVDGLLNNTSPTIAQLFEAHALARGEITQDITEADFVVLPKPADAAKLGIKEGAQVITAYDISDISANFMNTIKEQKDAGEKVARDVADDTSGQEQGDSAPSTDDGLER